MQVFRFLLIMVGIFVVATPRSCDAGSDTAQIAIAISSNTPAFEEALGAFKIALRHENALLLVFFPLQNNEVPRNLPGVSRPRLGVAFGLRAFETLASSDPTLPLVAAMVLEGDTRGHITPQRFVPTVSLSISPALILSKLKATFPGKKRVAVLLSPNSSALRGELSVNAQRLGYMLEIVECTGPKDVLSAIGSLRGRVDFVWCLPDSNLFPSAAIPPIILASIRNRIPLIGFSEGFVRAGATIGFYPDYAEIGVQTAEMVKRYISNQELPRVEAPRKIRIAVNDRVLRLLGIDRPDESSEVLIIR